ncbi:hypothetical protein Leryth_019069 [Lithospermum erythrorhizon]|nr:hypothetical protein Leryth_019069 [Lithospermum erythrorhizon]
MKAWEATVRITQAAAKKRGNIFGMYSSPQHTEEYEIDDDLDEDEHHNGEVHIAEKFLANGDYYTGHWVNNIPHGIGKYWWSDGCMFVGEWFKGKIMGKGTFSWPSGAMYEGNFKNGYMDGEGTYTSPNGDTYKGSWVKDMKHGYGTKEYANGDVYEGEWFRGLQGGRGRYTWENENNYEGEWKDGVICGKGKICLNNGSFYEGYWEDGLPKGNGTFKWPDGSFYVGNWSKNPDEQNGNYYPSGEMLQEHADWDPQEVFNVDLKKCVVYPNENIYILPSQKMLAIDNKSYKVGDSSSRHRRTSVDGRVEAELGNNRLSDSGCPSSSSSPATPMRGGRDSNADITGVEEGCRRGSPLRLPKVVKRQGETICKGHKNYELMLNLQLGIRHAVGRPGPQPSLDLKPSAFDPKEKFWTRFPPDGSKHTPPHSSSEFRWKDYCPKVFRTLRMLFKVDPADYMLSICGDNALRELSSPGKSGSFFYLTSDDRYMIKTMKKAEMKVLLRMLNAYYNHVRSFENTLLTKFFGLHSVKLGPAQKKKLRIYFCTSYTIHKRYDLKGSTFGRVTNKPESQIDANTTLKDLDLNFIFKLQNAWFQEFIRQVDRDSELLEQERIMDYSLLVGLHFKAASEDNLKTPPPPLTPTGDRASKGDQLIPDPNGWGDIKLGVSMPARVEMTERKNDNGEPQLVGQPIGEYYDVVMFFSIIDILQDYDITKKLEHAYKSIQYDPNSISAVDPRQYSRRFRDYIFNVFREDI